jgi:hypothetical protein
MIGVPTNLKTQVFGKRSLLVLWSLFLFVPCILSAVALDPAATAQKQYWLALAKHTKQATNGTLAWEFARACFDAAEYATNSSERAEIAQQGIKACLEVLAREPKSAPAHYYYGMNLGQLAQTKGIGALKVAEEMKREFNIARQLDETIDYAGPDRNLGMYYRDAPGFVGGSRTKAIEHLKHASEVAPEYPDNRLALIEAELKWNDRNGARRELKELEEVLPKARATFADQQWASSWTSWDARYKDLKRKIEGPSKTLETPHEQ